MQAWETKYYIQIEFSYICINVIDIGLLSLLYLN